ncbi:unnamed protein product [Orchesella dallaii]|uniref:O-acyltransferase WSD1 C-terminal domain-containing protein n=1 Tax=Orchesella dallaii TaxID=48710 RepID=A0ABP1RZA8_9HEXA
MISYLQPVLWLPSYILRGFALLIASWTSKLGNILNPISTLLADEDYDKYPPKNSLIGTVTVDGDVSLEEFQDLFKRTVLEATIPTNPILSWKQPHDQTRYPEFQQYQINFLGFKFWKDDPNFQIENHIVEKVLTNEPSSLQNVHKEMHNKLFVSKRSPWEVILIKNYRSVEDGLGEHEEQALRKTVIVARFHHSMADAKSILKVFVIGLGQRPLCLAKPQLNINSNILSELLFYLRFPFVYYLSVISGGLYKAYQSSFHAWRVNMFGANPRQVIGMSSKLSLHDIKQVAKRNNVTTSAVVLSLMTGAMCNIDAKFREKWVIAGHIGALVLPTDQITAAKRLQACQKNFADLKERRIEKYYEFVHLQAGTLNNPLRKMTMRNIFFPVGVTNIAGESHEFSIGQNKCSEFTFSLGTLTGCAGVIFTSSSYKDYLRVAVAADESIMDEIEAQKLAQSMWNELEMLKSILNQ